ncbi:3-deoxy-manno-octulosonate cytidylyltransferase [Methylophaga sp.]|jgi:3-deoxy-manno-octulosonate cytidylyltransferase (CMP-KDO synthetase)|uniref:3-deoxy-manno-octulosonate cytidylyltransferase n=1 Tax=Methylophaga sp. TaxID=2024840 RepID=UPI003F72BF27
MQFKIIIPARFASSRLPGKPLRQIVGKPMIQHVYERALESEASEVIIATDDQRIAEAAKSFGADVCMTRDDHISGTDRLAEVAQLRAFHGDDLVVNVQGDEPCLPAVLINQVAADLAHHREAAITTLYSPLEDAEQVFDPNIVKVVVDAKGYAMYFSRAPIPWLREQFNNKQALDNVTMPHLKHVGMYAYRADFLHRYHELPPAPPEQFESLEQLRALYHGNRIHLTEAQVDPGHGVDTEQDLLAVEALLSQ